MSNIRDFINLTNLYTTYITEANTRELAKKLYDAGAGKTFGTEEKDIYDILDSISAEDFSQVVNDYKDMYDGANLVTDLKNEMSGKELTTLNQKLEKLNATEFSQFAPNPETTNTNTAPQPNAQTTAPAQPQEPTTGTTSQPATPRTDEPAMPIDGDVAPEGPAQTAPGSRPDLDTTTVPPATAPGSRPDLDTTTVPPATAAPAQPGQQTSGLPAKLSQIKSANLMKDYNAGGKKEMQSVKDVQLALSRLGHDPNGIDGKYGPGTFKAVQEFQKANGLSVDGQVGPNTIKAMIDKLGGAAPEPSGIANAPGEITSTPAAPSADANAISDADTEKDSARVEELISKLDVTSTQQNQSTDFSHLIAIVEGRILKEALSTDEVKELQGIVAKHKNNPKFKKELLSRAEAAVAASAGAGKPAQDQMISNLDDFVNDPPKTAPEKKLKDLEKVSAPDNTVAPVSAAPTTGSGNPTPANADAGKPAQPDFAKQARDQEALNKRVQANADAKALGDFGGSQDPTAMKPNTQGDDAAMAVPVKQNATSQNVVRDGSGKVVKSGDGTPVRTRSDNQIWWDQNMQGKPFPGDAAAQKAIDARKAQGDKNWNSIKNFFGGNKTQQTQSKDLSMKTAMNESASMNVSMTGDNAAEVAELMKLLKNAGMPDAGPVKDIMPPMAPKGDMADFMGMVDSGMQGPAEPCSVCGEVHEETSCSEDTSEYDAIIDEWDNSPEEEYKDHNYMTQDLSGGINRPKKAYAKAQDGDNAMAVEAIKSDLRKALEEALKGK